MLIDQARLAALKDDVGHEVFAEVLEMSVEELDEAMDALDPPDAAKLHFLKGSALNVGMVSFSDLCADAESSKKANPASAVDTKTLHSLYASSRTELLAAIPV